MLGTVWQLGRRVSAAGVDLLFPPQCVACGGQLADPPGPWICRLCRRQMVADQGVACPRCAALKVEANRACVECRQRSFRFQGAVALGPYRELLRDTVIRMKQRHQQITAFHMGWWLALRHRHAQSLQQLDAVVPIPKYWVQRMRSGTNAAEWIGRGIGSLLNVPLEFRLLAKTRPTRKQSLLSESQRRRNLRGALSPGHGYDIAGWKILLVDDLMTTGATVDEATRVLRRAGAAEVHVAVVARAQSLWPSWPARTLGAPDSPVAASAEPADGPRPADS